MMRYRGFSAACLLGQSSGKGLVFGTNQQENGEDIIPSESILNNRSAIEPEEERDRPNGEHDRGDRICQRLKVVYRHDAVPASSSPQESETNGRMNLLQDKRWFAAPGEGHHAD